MAPRSQPTGTDTKEKLVVAATREFALRGYDGASLRQICSSAGVTTGALYFFFKNKEDLFRTVIDPVVTPMGAMLGEAGRKGSVLAFSADDELAALALPGENNVAHRFLELCFDQRSLVQIMVKNRETAVVESILDDASSTLASNIKLHLEAHDIDLTLWDDFMVGWLADIALDSVVGILEMDDTLEEARQHMQIILEFIHGGCRALQARGVRGKGLPVGE